jgi:type II secretory pathway component PulJ
MFRRGGGFGLPMTDNPLELLVALLIFAVLIWLAFRFISSI